MRLAIVGSRGITHFDLASVIKEKPSLIITGGAKGIDEIAARYAASEQIPLSVITPDYAKYGRIAPIVRNKAIIDSADEVIAVWDGKSRGTLSAIDFARRQHKPCAVYRC